MSNTAKEVKPAMPVRRERVRPSGPRDKLTVYGKDPNFVYRWVRNDEGRIQWFQERGYEVVTQDLEVGQKTVDSGSKLGSAVTKFGGGAVTLVLMRIPKEWYDEDQAAKEDAVASTEATMRNPDSQVNGAYGSGLKITRK
jgi:hypothetical protein